MICFSCPCTSRQNRSKSRETGMFVSDVLFQESIPVLDMYFPWRSLTFPFLFHSCLPPSVSSLSRNVSPVALYHLENQIDSHSCLLLLSIMICVLSLSCFSPFHPVFPSSISCWFLWVTHFSLVWGTSSLFLSWLEALLIQLLLMSLLSFSLNYSAAVSLMSCRHRRTRNGKLPSSLGEQVPRGIALVFGVREQGLHEPLLLSWMRKWRRIRMPEATLSLVSFHFIVSVFLSAISWSSLQESETKQEGEIDSQCQSQERTLRAWGSSYVWVIQSQLLLFIEFVVFGDSNILMKAWGAFPFPCFLFMCFGWGFTGTTFLPLFLPEYEAEAGRIKRKECNHSHDHDDDHDS